MSNKLSRFADQLGQLRANMKVLKDQAAAIEAELKASGKTVIEGALYQVNVVKSERRNTDWAAVAEKMHASYQLVTANTTIKDVVAVKCSAFNK